MVRPIRVKLFLNQKIDRQLEHLRCEAGRCGVAIELPEVIDIRFGYFRRHGQPDGRQSRPAIGEPSLEQRDKGPMMVGDDA